MPTVAELTAVYGNFMLTPRPGPSVCRMCFNFTDGYTRLLRVRARRERRLTSSRRSPTASAANSSTTRSRATSGSAVTWRAESPPSSPRCCGATWPSTRRASRRPPASSASTSSRRSRRATASATSITRCRRIVAKTVGPTRGRHERLLTRSTADIPPREFNPDKFEATRPLDGEPVLLIDDTWTTGASAQSAAAALKRPARARSRRWSSDVTSTAAGTRTTGGCAGSRARSTGASARCARVRPHGSF